MTCYGLVRGEVIRVTPRLPNGTVDSTAVPVVSKNVTRLSIEEVNESARSEQQYDGERRLRLRTVRPSETVRYDLGGTFPRVHADLFKALTNLDVVTDALGNVVGFDRARKDHKQGHYTFALEVWTGMDSSSCGPDVRWGYTFFPFVKAGRIGGLSIQNGLVAFTMTGAQIRKTPGDWASFSDVNVDVSALTAIGAGEDRRFWRHGVVSTPPPIPAVC